MEALWQHRISVELPGSSVKSRLVRSFLLALATARLIPTARSNTPTFTCHGPMSVAICASAVHSAPSLPRGYLCLCLP
jgi:hypothetical protein